MVTAVEGKATTIEGIGALADRYDSFILDQWGVLHDGSLPYPGAVECLERLRAKGRRIVLLSNSGRRAGPNVARLARIGFAPDLYDAFVTSGEATWLELAIRDQPFYRGLGRRCLLFSRGGDRSVVEGLDLTLVDEVGSADFILLGGIDAPPLTEADFEPVLNAALRRRLPMICANPDRVGLRDGRPVLAPGAVARRYQAMGGRVRLIGKPWPEIYRPCLAALNGGADESVVAVGDSLEHDIAGGIAMRLDTVLVQGGIYADHFAGLTAAETQARLAALCREHGATPTWTLPAFRW